MGTYVLGKRLGAGGMGAVYESTRPNGSRVAIKLPYIETLDDDRTARRFQDEGIAGSIVDHPHLARVVERGVSDGIPYLVMDRITGVPLSKRIARSPLPLRHAAKFLRELLDALQALHACGIVHADVKTDNVLIAERDGCEVAMLVDFGLAHPSVDGLPRVSGDVVSGTPQYMAPEVIRGEGSTAASDIYSAGAILYELITGEPPFAGATSSEIFRQHLVDRVIPPSLRRPECPPILERIVLRALEKDPSRRFASAAAFASALGVALPTLDDVPPSFTSFATDAPTLDFVPTHTRKREVPDEDAHAPSPTAPPPSRVARALSQRARTRRRGARRNRC